MYNDKIMTIFENPIHIGQIKGASGKGKYGPDELGNAIKVSLKINDDSVVTDAKFKAQGSVGLIATASLTMDYIIGKSIDDIMAITEKDILKLVNGLPESRKDCATMVKTVIENAIKDYRKMLVKMAEKISKAVDKAE